VASACIRIQHSGDRPLTKLLLDFLFKDMYGLCNSSLELKSPVNQRGEKKLQQLS